MPKLESALASLQETKDLATVQSFLIGASTTFSQALDMKSEEFYESNGWDTSVLYNHPFLDPKATVRENCDRHTKWIHNLAPPAPGAQGTRNWKQHPYHKDNNVDVQRQPFPHNISFADRIASGELVQSSGRPSGVTRCLTCIFFHRDCYEGPIRRGGKCSTCQGSEGISMASVKPTETPMYWETGKDGVEKPVWRIRGQTREPYWPLLRYFINDYQVAKIYEGGRFVDRNNRAGIAARNISKEVLAETQSRSGDAAPKRGQKRKNNDTESCTDRPKKVLRSADTVLRADQIVASLEETAASNQIKSIQNPLRAVKYSNKDEVQRLSNDEVELEYEKLRAAPAQMYLRGMPRAGITAQTAINIAGEAHRKALEIAADPGNPEVGEDRAQIEMSLMQVKYKDIVDGLDSWYSDPGIEVSRDAALRLQAALNLSSSDPDLAKVYSLLDCNEVTEEITRLKKLAESRSGRISGIDVLFDDFEKEIIISKLVIVSEFQSLLCADLMIRVGFDGGIDRIYEHKANIPDFLWMQLDRAAAAN